MCSSDSLEPMVDCNINKFDMIYVQIGGAFQTHMLQSSLRKTSVGYLSSSYRM